MPRLSQLTSYRRELLVPISLDPAAGTESFRLVRRATPTHAHASALLSLLVLFAAVSCKSTIPPCNFLHLRVARSVPGSGPFCLSLHTSSSPLCYAHHHHPSSIHLRLSFILAFCHTLCSHLSTSIPATLSQRLDLALTSTIQLPQSNRILPIS